MTKAVILAMLRTKYSNLGLSEKTLGELADAILAKEGLTAETLESEVDAVAPYLKLAQKEAHRQLEAFKAKPDDKKPKEDVVPDSGNDKPTDTDVPAWAKALIDSNKKLTDDLLAMKQGKTAETRKQEFTKLLEGLPESMKTEYLEDFDLIAFKDDDHYKTWSEKKAIGFEAIKQETKVEAGANFGRPIVPKGTNIEKASTSMQNFLKEKETQSKDGGVAVGKSPFE